MEEDSNVDKEVNVDSVQENNIEGTNQGEKTEENIEKIKEKKIIQTDIGSKDGQNKCPKCGATDISLNTKNGKLRCNFCRHEFEPEKVESLEVDINTLEGDVFASGTQDIEENSQDVITLKCSSCGAEVVIDTENSVQARCHWCRNTLSINSQIPNGAVPDVVLPFNLTKAEAKEQIKNFVGKRKFYAHPTFKKEFSTENVMGVYFPYMVVDVNSHATFSGQGEHETRRYTRKEGDNYKTYYDADLYDVEREFDLAIDGLTVESSSDKLQKNSNKTNNIINSIMPFDIENSVKYNANYLKGYTSEKRDTNIEQLRPIVDSQSKDIARFACNETLSQYDRGVRWDNENLSVKGNLWKTAYFPVWLYSYQEKKKNDKTLLHYVAVNARTKETMGSVPIHMPKLLGISVIVEIIGLIVALFITVFSSSSSEDSNWGWFFLLAGFIYFGVIYAKYRNTGARHHHETETKKETTNIRKVDTLIKNEKGLSNSTIKGANNKKVNGSIQSLQDTILNKITK